MPHDCDAAIEVARAELRASLAADVRLLLRADTGPRDYHQVLIETVLALIEGPAQQVDVMSGHRSDPASPEPYERAAEHVAATVEALSETSTGRARLRAAEERVNSPSLRHALIAGPPTPVAGSTIPDRPLDVAGLDRVLRVLVDHVTVPTHEFGSSDIGWAVRRAKQILAHLAEAPVTGEEQ